MILKFKRAKLLLPAGLFIILISCSRYTAVTADKDLLDKKGIDSTVRPQDDFYNYVNGGWIKHTEIPASEPAWGAISLLYQNTIQILRTLLDSCASLNAAKGTNEQKVGDFYASAMDSASIEQKGITPLNSDLQRISAIQNSKDVLHELAVEYDMNVSSLIDFSADQDDKNSNKVVAHFDQGGLGLPNKNYYVQQDSATINIRKNYVQYMAAIFHLTGQDDADAHTQAAAVMEIETALARASKSPVELRNPEANYHKMTLKALSEQTPNLHWQELVGYLGIKPDTVLVGQPVFYKALDSLLIAVPADAWKSYLRFHLINNYAYNLSSDFVNAKFNLTKLLTGQKELQPRWKRMVALTDRQLGDAVGQLYVSKYFPPEAKQRILSLVNNLQQTYKDRILQLSWMSDSTKQKALIKLNAFAKKIGYPDKWKDYSSIEITKHDLIQNLKNTGRFAHRYMINKIDKPVDRTEWLMTPPTINAYYNTNTNDINFPSGILQPPFFYKDGDDAINYGAIGMVIGHEMTHGFDDRGRLYDAEGNLRNWWLPADSASFKQKADMVVKQYNNSIILDSLHVNGELTEGENIADIGGMSIAYEAFKKTDEGKSNKKIGGLTPDQRFFISYAEIWRNKIRPERARNLIMTDPHSPTLYRVNNPLSNMPAFYKAFDVKAGDKMYKADSVRVQVW